MIFSDGGITVKKVGIVGTGNMGSALLHGILDANYMKPANVSVHDADYEKMESLSREIPGLGFCDHVQDLASNSDIIIIAVKPGIVSSVIEAMGPALKGKAVVSIAAGWTCGMLERALSPYGCSYLRVMPNTPAMVGEGMTALCLEHTMTEDDYTFAKGIFDSLGRTVELHEKMFDGVIALSGSSPAYVFMLIETMAQAGVRYGIPMNTAIEMAAQSVLGSALMVLSSGDHPAVLRDHVCSPAGTTIEAVAAMEESGFRNALLQGMDACVRKSREMSQKQ